MSAGATVTIHSSWKGVLSSSLGAGAVAVGGAASTVASGGTTGSLVLLAIGTVLLLIVLFDYPVASEFDARGVVRRSPLRRHRIAWAEVDQLTRARPGMSRGGRDLVRDGRSVNAGRILKPGGLTVKIGRRRYLLVDQCESQAEHERLIRLLQKCSGDLGLDLLLEPPNFIDPTWTYRRVRWQPDAQSSD